MIQKYLKKIILLTLAQIVICQGAYATQLDFDGESYGLKFSKESPLTKGYINEYVRANENLKSWTKLLGVYYYPNESSPIELARKMAFVVKTANKDAGVSVIINDKENAAIVEFLTWPLTKNANEKTFLEFNVFKYQKDNKNCVVALQYARRYYPENNDTIKFISDDMKNNRARLIKLMATTEVPKVIEKEIL